MRVFISSTSQDLEPYRAAAGAVVRDLGWQPVMMEHFGTDGRNPGWVFEVRGFRVLLPVSPHP